MVCTRYLAEQLVQAVHPRWLVIRMAGFVGLGLRKNAIFDMLTGATVWLGTRFGAAIYRHAGRCSAGLVVDRSRDRESDREYCCAVPYVSGTSIVASGPRRLSARTRQASGTSCRSTGCADWSPGLCLARRIASMPSRMQCAAVVFLLPDCMLRTPHRARMSLGTNDYSECLCHRPSGYPKFDPSAEGRSVPSCGVAEFWPH